MVPRAPATQAHPGTADRFGSIAGENLTAKYPAAPSALSPPKTAMFSLVANPRRL
jgi:hypothetical protein